MANVVNVGNDDLEKFFADNHVTKYGLNRNRRDVKTKFATPSVNDERKENYTYKMQRGDKSVRAQRNRLSDRFVLTALGQTRKRDVERGIEEDTYIVHWSFYCPGKEGCKRICGGYGQCTPDCTVQRKGHDGHNCSVRATARIMISDPSKWIIDLNGSHVPEPELPNFVTPSNNMKIAESIKDNIMMCRDVNMKPYEVFRHQICDVTEENMKEKFADTRYHPSDVRINDFIKNTERRHTFQGGQWTAAHNIAVSELKDRGILLYLQNGSSATGQREVQREGFVMAVSNSTALASARKNQHCIGIDGKHGLQDDGACLMTAVTQHHDGFGCPASFTLMNREYSENIYLALRAIIENVPCVDENCQHTFRYHELPNNRGWRRITECANINPYMPIVMIDKFEASANACQELGLTYILCWFHVVKAIMEKLKQMGTSIDNSYVIVLAFKLVARSEDINEAEIRWNLFLQVINKLPLAPGKKLPLQKYFTEEWWCDRWRNAWLDFTRRPLTIGGNRAMTTNNLDENLNLKVANSVGGRRKKVSTLLYELTGYKAANEGSDEPTTKKLKASILDTQAAKTTLHDLNKKDNTPRDIQLRRNKARYLFLTNAAKQEADNDYYFVIDTNSKQKRFKDHRGEWVTVPEESSKLLDEMWKTLSPPGIEVPSNAVLANIQKKMCICNDFVWRSSLRDSCIHIKCAQIMHDAGEDPEATNRAEMSELCNFLRRKEKAKPKEGRDSSLCADDNEVVFSRMKDLVAQHGNKVWKIMSTGVRKPISDEFRPMNLPRDQPNVGNPRQRNAKPRTANPFKRKRRRNENHQVKNHAAHKSVKRMRNSARRAASKLVSRARKARSTNAIINDLSCIDLSIDTEHQEENGASSSGVISGEGTSSRKTTSNDRTHLTQKGAQLKYDVSSRKDRKKSSPETPESDYQRLRRRWMEVEKGIKESPRYRVQKLIADSPSISRGRLILRLAKMRTNTSSFGRQRKRKSYGSDFSIF